MTKTPPKRRGHIGKQWVKGQSGNPKGASGITAEIRTLRLANSRELFEAVTEAWRRNHEAHMAFNAGPGTTMLQTAIHKLVERAAFDGDVKSFNELNQTYAAPVSLMDDNINPEDLMLLARVKSIIALPKEEKINAIAALLNPVTGAKSPEPPVQNALDEPVPGS